MGVAWIDSPIGALRIEASAKGLTAVSFEDAPGHDAPGDDADAHTHLRLARDELTAYFAGDRGEFKVALAPYGTAFQHRVWAELRGIGFGETLSYGALARRLGDEKATRAVGLANGRNPIAIIIPCHRIIGADGTLTGYGGGLSRKRWLLEHEGAGLFAPGGAALSA